MRRGLTGRSGIADPATVRDRRERRLVTRSPLGRGKAEVRRELRRTNASCGDRLISGRDDRLLQRPVLGRSPSPARCPFGRDPRPPAADSRRPLGTSLREPSGACRLERRDPRSAAGPGIARAGSRRRSGRESAPGGRAPGGRRWTGWRGRAGREGRRSARLESQAEAPRDGGPPPSGPAHRPARASRRPTSTGTASRSAESSGSARYETAKIKKGPPRSSAPAPRRAPDQTDAQAISGQRVDRGKAQPAAAPQHQGNPAHRTCTMASTSTGTLTGSPPIPRAERACRPRSPSTARNTSDAPFPTSEQPENPGAALT